uniref:Uncharacterized protein n=1 Tax=Rhabditophanes sp. KR3021 TaxID=114890 RepID=A0AC35U711_9BILA
MEKKSLQLDCSLISSKPTNSNTASNVDMTVSATNASAKYMLSETKARSFSGVFEEKLQCERDAKTGTSRSGDYPLTTSTHKNNSCVTLNSNSTHDSNHKLDKVPPLLNNFSSKPKVQPNLRKLKKVDSRIIMLQGEPFYHDEFFSGKPA